MCWCTISHTTASPNNTSQGLFAKRRQLILTDKPRLLYVDEGNDVVKGEIPWYVTMQCCDYRAA